MITALTDTGISVELLSAYSNTSPELNEVLNALSRKPESLESRAGSVASPPRKLRGRLPRSIISKIVADYQAGRSSRDLAAAYNLPKSSLLAILNKEGAVRPAKRITDEQVQAASLLIQQGKSVAIAAADLDIAVRSLYHQLKLRRLPTKAG